MNKLTKIGATALAGALVSVSAHAADWSISGSAGFELQKTTKTFWLFIKRYYFKHILIQQVNCNCIYFFSFLIRIVIFEIALISLAFKKL